MKAALRAWLAAAARGADPVEASRAAAEAVLDAHPGDPWAVVEQAGLLCRAELRPAPRDLGLRADLRPVDPDHRAALIRVEAGAPMPVLDGGSRKRRGAWDTPRALCQQVVRAALSAVGAGPVRTGLDPACGPGAFLLTLAEAGILDISGQDTDARALAVARVALPRARLSLQSGLEPGEPVDVLVGNPPFVPPEHQDKLLRKQLQARFPWLDRRFDLAVPFAAAAMERTRSGGGLGLLLPASLLSQPYARALRRCWLSEHRLTEISLPLPFPGATVKVVVLALEVGGPPTPLPGHGLHPEELLRLPEAPLDRRLRPGDALLIERIRACSLPLGELCEVDTGVVSHGPLGGKARLLFDAPGPGRVPYVDARDLVQDRRRWLLYQPETMHRPKRPALFAPPKLLVQRLRGRGPIRVHLDEEGIFAGHTLNVVRPRAPIRIAPARLQDLLRSPLSDGLLRIERGDRLDLYPHDLAQLPVPRRWLLEPALPLEQAWNLSPADAARLSEMAGLALSLSV